MSVRLNVWSNVRWPRRVYHLVSHAEYAPLAVLRIEKRRDRWTDGRTSDRYISLTAKRVQRNNLQTSLATVRTVYEIDVKNFAV